MSLLDNSQETKFQPNEDDEAQGDVILTDRETDYDTVPESEENYSDDTSNEEQLRRSTRVTRGLG